MVKTIPTNIIVAQKRVKDAMYKVTAEYVLGLCDFKTSS